MYYKIISSLIFFFFYLYFMTANNAFKALQEADFYLPGIQVSSRTWFISSFYSWCWCLRLCKTNIKAHHGLLTAMCSLILFTSPQLSSMCLTLRTGSGSGSLNIIRKLTPRCCCKDCDEKLYWMETKGPSWSYQAHWLYIIFFSNQFKHDAALIWYPYALCFYSAWCDHHLIFFWASGCDSIILIVG